MFSILKEKPLIQLISLSRLVHLSFSLYSTVLPGKSESPDFRKLCHIVSSGVGGLDELEASLDNSKPFITSKLVTQILDSCRTEAPTRRLLRFFSWSKKNSNNGLDDEVFNYAIRVFAQKKDVTALNILLSDLRKEERTMEIETFSLVTETLIKMGREDEAMGIFKNLDKFNCPKDKIIVSAIVHNLCSKGHAKKAEGVVFHHKNVIFGEETYIYKNLLHGWCVNGNVKEARRILDEMKSVKVRLDLFCYNSFLKCLCESNLKSNPSALVPEAFDLMIEMRSYKIIPNTVSFNVLLSCLGKARRVSESYRILHSSMKSSGCSPDWVSYYLVVRVSYLTGRFGKGNGLVDEMIEVGLIPKPKFFHDLIGVLCGVERVGHALWLFERMKGICVGDYAPVYDLLIPKLSKGGKFEKAKQLWDEAMEKGIALSCSSDVLNPSIAKVFKPVKKLNE